MSERAIGSMQIENDFIEIVETNPVETEDARRVFLSQFYEPDFNARIITEWWAKVKGDPIAYACLIDFMSETQPGKTAYLYVVVVPERRGYGIGTVMTRFSTDLAIRHRQSAVVAASTPTFKRILENEEFEESEGLMRKELKWQ